MDLKIKDPIAWDTNLLTLDGYDGEKDVTIDLKNIYTIHISKEGTIEVGLGLAPNIRVYLVKQS